MYRGLARLVGMDILSTGTTFSDEIKTLKERYNDYDFFFVHVKAWTQRVKTAILTAR